jgi:hypothetical protein
MAHFPRLAAVLLVSTLAACGGKSIDVGDPDPSQGGSGDAGSGAGGSVGTSGTDTGGTGTGGTNTGGTGIGGTGTAGTGIAGDGGVGGSQCDQFRDESASFIGVDIINDTASTIYLGQTTTTCEVDPLFSVKDASGVGLPSPSRCRSGCGNGFGGCTAICLFPSAIELAPGASMRTSWDGLYDIQINLPPECSSAPGEGARSCQQSKQIQPGNFTFSALAGTSIDCSQTVGAMCGACQPDGNGNCATQGALIGGEFRTASTMVLLNADYGVYQKTINPFPNPNPGGADAPAGARALLSVQIIFKD